MEEAAAHYRQALQLKPKLGDAHYNFANLLFGQGSNEEAITHYRQALKLGLDIAEVRHNLGLALKAQGKLKDAEINYRRAIERNPDLASIHNNLGIVLSAQGHVDEAISCYRRALEIDPDYVEARYNLGLIFLDRGMLDEAVDCYRRALEIKPDYAEALSAMGNAYGALDKAQEAIDYCTKAVKANPGLCDAHNNLGTALQVQGQLDEAIRSFQRALEIEPVRADVHSNLGAAFHRQLRLDQASASYRRALELQPNYAEARWSKSLLQLLQGDYEHGWPEYEWRWHCKPMRPRRFDQPLWDGRPVNGTTILIYHEQGLGDTIQFVRYAACVKNLGARVIIESQKALLRLLERCPGIDQLVASGDELAHFDCQVPMVSLPWLFKTSMDTIPRSIPYLHPDPALVEEWRRRLTNVPGFRIGINWQGRGGHGAHRERDIPLDCFTALAEIPSVKLISLQKGTMRELTEVEGHLPIVNLGRIDEEHGPFMDTAAIMMNLDLVITSDTSVPHLAGALGVPVWLALPFVPNWRWLLERSDSPWYPTMRLFRQKQPGNWKGVFEEIKLALRERV